MKNVNRLSTIKTPEQFSALIQKLGINLGFDETLAIGTESPFVMDYRLKDGRTIGNRFCVQPMEGWDAMEDGTPSNLTRRRWLNFGKSGAKLIWGGEAVAVMPEGRANPNQLILNENTLPAIRGMREDLVKTHSQAFGETADLLVGLQLTHSGRFCRPVDKKKLAPRTLYNHPLLNSKFGLEPDITVLTDQEIRMIIQAYIQAAQLAELAGFDFVDLKHCHGYLGHEFLSAVDRPGSYGGSFENRTSFLREMVEGIHSACPDLRIGVRFSAFDFIPFEKNLEGEGRPVDYDGFYPYAFGGDGSGVGVDLSEPEQFLTLLESLGIELVNITSGSPYYVPHIQRPAMYPPSDGYLPPEDPLVGVARLLSATASLKKNHPGLLMVGTGYSYLQEWLPFVAQFALRTGDTDFIGLGRMMLSYPEFCADVLAGKPLDRKKICRTFSDCTTAPRNGMVSGCYPLDHFYKNRPEAKRLKDVK
ncbi:MAG: NADH:flavin oxidoreductase [Anaerolineaceae bacterium]|nr:NADH:flavin oxidoreductase [Anaerolineaceae bacterium]